MASAIGNTAESDILKLVFQNTSWANVGNAGGLLQSTVAGNFYVETSTGALTGASTQSTTESAYTGYGRVPVARSSAGWTISGSAPTTAANTAAVTFGLSSSGPEVEVAVSIGRDAAAAGEVIYWGVLTASLTVNPGITPSFAIGVLAATLL